MVICVYGSASELIDEKYLSDAFELGKFLAEKGHSLIYGAGGFGVMGAVARGFKAGGGKVHGVIPQFFKDEGYEGIFYEADEITYTETMAERKSAMENGCDAFVIAPGGIGTFEEFFEAYTLKQLGRHVKPIAVFNSQGYYDGLLKMLNGIIEKQFVNKECLELIRICDTKEDVIKYFAEKTEKTIAWNRLKARVK